jgi:hypothetical protein
MLIIQGRLGLEAGVGRADGASSETRFRFTSRSAGTPVGSLAAAGGASLPTRLGALSDVAVFGLTEDALGRLNGDHPRVAASLYRATAEALAAEHHWIAAENLALSS